MEHMDAKEKMRQEALLCARCRLAAAERAGSMEVWLKGMSLLYACMTALSALMSVVSGGKGFPMLTAFTAAAAALISACAVCCRSGRAEQLRANARALELLADSDEPETMLRVRLDALLASAVHTARDRRHALMLTDRENRRSADAAPRSLYGVERVWFWMGEIALMVFSVILACAPVACFVLAAAGVF